MIGSSLKYFAIDLLFKFKAVYYMLCIKCIYIFN